MRLASSLALALLVAAYAGAQQPSVKLLVQSSPLAGLRHHEAALVWHELARGDLLDLVREPDHPYDANAVRVDWRGHKLGYVPRRENQALAWAMDRGEPVAARISKLGTAKNARRRIELEVFIE